MNERASEWVVGGRVNERASEWVGGWVSVLAKALLLDLWEQVYGVCGQRLRGAGSRYAIASN